MLFHKEVYWPPQLKRFLPSGKQTLVYTNHAKDEAKKDKRGEIILPDSIDLDTAYVFEVELDRVVNKFAFRIDYDNTNSLVMVAIPRKKHLVIKTVWLNNNNDRHKSLNKKNYTQF